MFKKSNRIGLPRFLKLYYNYKIKNRGYNTALLCASAYASYDYSRIHAFKDKSFKWGYFPEVKTVDIDALMGKKRKAVPRLLWVGRLIDWKRTIDAVRLAERMKNDGYRFDLRIVGTGELEAELRGEVEARGLSDCVSMVGSLPQEQARAEMEEANILLITSDHNEGWGAVLNEGMNSGCAVVVSHGVGAAPYMLESGKNGLIYECADIDSIYRATVRCIDEPEFAEALGREAYATVRDKWCAPVAAKRLISLISSLKGEGKVSFDEGILSKAQIIKNDWIKRNERTV